VILPKRSDPYGYLDTDHFSFAPRISLRAKGSFGSDVALKQTF